MKEIEIKINQQGNNVNINAVIIYKEEDAKILSAHYFSKQRALKQYFVYPERLANIHEKYIVFDCYLIDIDPQIDYEHYYCVLEKK
ncbi:hypothetical protein [Chryseobacterium sp. 8AT]|uniref:hypothetical protein n=1 Tax=Chryseobacterium sp. 8AT TaxID=2653134 RepID=UPI0012F15D49|nr:hypothetical protein [Chryseobacterium sp. 8AT]VXB02086.1 hypothetical protein CHRYSEO8AT_10236 [Chryseobacterium sp. 8AT]